MHAFETYLRSVLHFASWQQRGSHVCATVLLLLLPALAQQAPVPLADTQSAAQLHGTGPGLSSHHAETVPDRDELPSDTKLISIRHYCGGDASPASARGTCEISVSKKEFETLAQALDPTMSAAARQSLAAEYARVLIMAAEASRRGVDRTAELQTLLEFSRLQLLATRLVQEIISNPPPVAPEEIDTFLRDHSRDYQRIAASRIFVPNLPSHDGMPARERAEALRARALAGADFATLQQEARAASPAGSESNLQVGPTLCLSLPEEHREICDFSPGEISRVFADKLGYSIYRLEARRTQPTDESRSEIRARLERERVQSEIAKFRTPLSLKLDERYFGKLPDSHLATQHGMHFPAVEGNAPSESGHSHQH